MKMFKFPKYLISFYLALLTQLKWVTTDIGLLKNLILYGFSMVIEALIGLPSLNFDIVDCLTTRILNTGLKLYGLWRFRKTNQSPDWREKKKHESIQIKKFPRPTFCTLFYAMRQANARVKIFATGNNWNYCFKARGGL